MVQHILKANFESLGVVPKIHVVQGDTGRVFIFDLAGVIGAEAASLMCKRPDGSVFSYAGVIDNSANTASFTLSAAGGAFTQTGEVSAQLVVNTDGVARSFKFDIIVEENISGTPTPEEVSFVDGLQAQVDEWIDGAQSQFDTLDDKIDQESINRQLAISSAIADEAAARNSAISGAIADEAAARNSAISTAISREETARDTAISIAVAQEADLREIGDEYEAAARMQAISALSARMDEFTQLPSGSTIGDAELMDIRIGGDGTTYSTAGNAVRGQFAKLSKSTRNLLSYEPAKSGTTTYDFGYDVTFDNGVSFSFDLTNVTASASAGFITLQNNAGTNVAVVTLNGTRNDSTGYQYSSESNPHNGRHHTASVAALKTSITFRKILINYSRITSGSADNFEFTANVTPTEFIPHFSAVDFERAEELPTNFANAALNSILMRDRAYWDITTERYRDNTGAKLYNAQYFTTRLFKIRPGDKVHYKFTAATNVPVILVFDNNKNLLYYTNGAGSGTYSEETYTFNSVSEYVAFNGIYQYINECELSYIAYSIDPEVKHIIKENRYFPSYWDSTVDDLVTFYNKTIMPTIASGDQFIFVTDQHWESNAQNSSALIDYIAERAGITLVLSGGDIVKSNNATQGGAYEEIRAYMKSFRNKSLRIFATLGNHDANSVAQSDSSAILPIEGQYNAMIKEQEAWMNTGGSAYCNYYDNVSQKIRYIQFWYTADSGYSETVANILTETMRNTPDDYTIVLLSHAYWMNSDTVAPGGVAYANLILDTMDEIEATVAVWLVGHVHQDKTDRLTSDGGKSLLIVSTTTDSCGQNSLNMPKYTNKEQAFDWVILDTAQKRIIMARFGYGVSRSMGY